jgi:AraC-like DNA-binding protein
MNQQINCNSESGLRNRHMANGTYIAPVAGPADHVQAARLIEGWLRRSGGRVYGAWGGAAPETDATVTGSTRLVLALSGRNAMRFACATEVQQVVLRAGDAVVIDRRAWNRPLHLYAKAFCTIDLKPDWLRVYLRRTRGPGSLPAEHATCIVPGAPHPALRAAADAAEALAAVGDPTLLAQSARQVAALAVWALRAPPPPLAGPWPRLRDWIEERLHQPLSRTAAARACGLHPGHVSRVMAAHAGLGFAPWVAARRLARARDLLLTTDLEANEIARRCGFASAIYFSHAFRAATGESPGRWRAARRR